MMIQAVAVEEIVVDSVPEAAEHLVAVLAIEVDLGVDLEVAIDLHVATLAIGEDSVIEVALPEADLAIEEHLAADAARVDTKDATTAASVVEAVKEGVLVDMVETGDDRDTGKRW
jgi:hypothetical protein